MGNIADKAFGVGYTYFSQIVNKELERIEMGNRNNLPLKNEITKNIADKAFGEGYTYFSQTVNKELEGIGTK